MSPLEQLFALEVEFHRRLRTEAHGSGDAAATHTSYALQSGYEQLLQHVGSVTESDVEALRERLLLAGDAGMCLCSGFCDGDAGVGADRDWMSAMGSILILAIGAGTSANLRPWPHLATFWQQY